MVTVADRIREERERQKLTQEELAKKMGYVNRSAVSMLEARGNDITLKKLKRVADALGCTTQFLLGWDDEEDDTDGLIYAEESAIRQKRIDKFPPEAIVELDTFIDYLEVKYSLK